MRTLYIGDVHGCADELTALLERARADRVILLGDLFTKGPDPVGVWRIVQQLSPQCVLGNHDAYVLKHWEDKKPAPAVRALRERAPEVREWLQGLPMMIREAREEGPDHIVVHAGVNPIDGPDGTTRRQALFMRRWPDDKDLSNPFWYDAGWSGPELVIFGHDAARGLVRREVNGQLVALGLDTGCVYGKALTGWLTDEEQPGCEQLLQVPAARAYKPIR